MSCVDLLGRNSYVSVDCRCPWRRGALYYGGRNSYVSVDCRIGSSAPRNMIRCRRNSYVSVDCRIYDLWKKLKEWVAIHT